jgi:CBS domain-containing protein
MVTFNGQFKPYSAPVSVKVNRLKGVAPEFNDLVEHYVDKDSTNGEVHTRKKVLASYEKNQNNQKRKVYARDIMSTKIKFLSPEHTILDGMTFLSKNKVHHIPIIEDSILVGIVSDRLLLAGLGSNKSKSTSLQEVMVKKLLVGQEHSSISEVARVMLEERINCIPITTKDLKLKGLVTSSDILELLVHSFPLEIYA